MPDKDKPAPRAFLYRHDCPEGRIFTGEEIDNAEKDGWVDSPKKIKKPRQGG